MFLPPPICLLPQGGRRVAGVETIKFFKKNMFTFSSFKKKQKKLVGVFFSLKPARVRPVDSQPLRRRVDLYSPPRYGFPAGASSEPNRTLDMAGMWNYRRAASVQSRTLTPLLIKAARWSVFRGHSSRPAQRRSLADALHIRPGRSICY